MSIKAVLLNSIGRCADCGCRIGQDEGPPDGWQLEDGRTVCHACAGKDLAKHDLSQQVEQGQQ